MTCTNPHCECKPGSRANRGLPDRRVRPGDRVAIDHDGTTIVRTVHSLTYAANDLESDGLNTTQGDWFALDDHDLTVTKL